MDDLQQLFDRREFIRKLAKDLGVRKDIADAAFFDEVISSTKGKVMVVETKKTDPVEPPVKKNPVTPPKEIKRSAAVSKQIGKMSKFISGKKSKN